jgi:hypothetical protein
MRFISPDFFKTLAIPLVLGRDVAESDVLTSPLVAIVSESFAKQYWPDQNPLGKQFHMATADRTVIGVAGNVRVRGLEQLSEPQVYLPYQQVQAIFRRTWPSGPHRTRSSLHPPYGESSRAQSLNCR